MAPSGGGGGADVVAVGGWSGDAGADAEAWQAQVEELLALQSVYESGFSILSAPGVHPGSGSGSGPGSSTGAGGSGGRSGSPGGSSDGGGGGASGAWADPLDAEELLALGPPPELTGAGPSSLGTPGSGPGPGPGWFVAEALVSCEVPPGGLQLVVEMPPMQPPPSPSPSPSPKPTAPSANEPPAVGPGSGPGQGQAQARAQAGPRVQGKQGGAQSPASAKEADGRAGGRGRGGGRGGRSSGREGARGGRAGPNSPPAPPIVVDAAPAPAPAPTPPPPPPVTVIPSEPPPPPQPPTRIPFGAPLHHLSPISVTLAFPPSYPAAEPPRVALRAPWLRPGQAAALRTALLRLWDEQGPGGPVAWTWLEWLRTDALQALGLTRELLLQRPSGGGAEDDEAGAEEAGAEAGKRLSRAELAAALAAAEADAAVVAAAAAQKGGAGYGGGGAGGAAAAAVALAAAGELQAVALAMARYSALRERQVFDSSNVSCSICLDEHLGARCVRLPECGDAFCGGCLATHLRTQLREGAVGNMRCPAPACRRQLPPALLREMLEPGEFERWERLTLQRTLDTMEDLVYCPRCRQPCLEDPDHSVLCPSCFFSFCSLCEESWHPGSACLDPEARLTLLEARRRRVAGAEAGEGGEGEGDEEGGEGGGAGRHRVSLTELARKELDKRNQLKSLAMMRSTTRQCPMCHMAVEKSEGCNKMTCAYCGTFFCWKCGMSIHGYDHFSQEPGQGGCVLFDQEEIDRWNARWGGPARPEPRQPPALAAWMQGVPAGQEVRIRHCTVCGQPNVKVGNNNAMRCWSCNSHFCYLCRAWLRNKPGEHFGTGAGKCRQHSPD